MDKAKQLANQHWGWLSDLLDALGLQEFNKKTLGYIYRTAFQHGWKHAVEELKRTTIVYPIKTEVSDERN